MNTTAAWSVAGGLSLERGPRRGMELRLSTLASRVSGGRKVIAGATTTGGARRLFGLPLLEGASLVLTARNTMAGATAVGAASLECACLPVRTPGTRPIALLTTTGGNVTAGATTVGFVWKLRG